MATIGTNRDDSDLSQHSSALSCTLARAVDLFVMRKFDTCFEVCCNVVKAAKHEPEQERNHEVIEAAAALGIQALAEMDQWQDTVAFIKQVYGDVHLCSARIVQVCILLHAHVEEYLPCHKLVQTWLQHPDNANSKHCAQVIRQYGYHILLPTGQFGILEEIINMCPSLDEKEKGALLKLPEAGRYKDAKSMDQGASAVLQRHLLNLNGELNQSNEVEGDLSLPDCDRTSNSNAVQKSSSETDPQKPEDQVCVLELCQKLYSSFLGRMKSSWRERFIVIVMALFALWALVQTQTGDSVSSLGRLVTLWRGLLHRLKLLMNSS